VLDQPRAGLEDLGQRAVEVIGVFGRAAAARERRRRVALEQLDEVVAHAVRRLARRGDGGVVALEVVAQRGDGEVGALFRDHSAHGVPREDGGAR
jgi:hypothetical protein